MKYIKPYNEGIVNNFRFIINLFPSLFNKAIKNMTNLHESITEEHILDFIVHYVLNNYNVDISHSKDMYKYVKLLIHNKIKNINKNRITEIAMSIPQSADNWELFDAVRSLNVVRIKQLLREGANTNIQNRIGRTPLMNAVTVEYTTQAKIIKVVELLVNKNADLNIKDFSNKETALIKAAILHRGRVVEALIELGAEWYHKNNDGKDFLDFFNDQFREDMKDQYPEQYQEYLLKKDTSKYNL